VRLTGVRSVILAAALLTGCGEPSQNVQFEGGNYAGKPDAPAWQGGSRDDWEAQIKRRGQLQNEYTRLRGG